MNETASIISMTEQNRQISEIIAEERSRLSDFIRRRVPDPSDAEDIVQEVFYELVEANRLLMPIEHVTGWLFRIARNRITDLLDRKSTRLNSSHLGISYAVFCLKKKKTEHSSGRGWPRRRPLAADGRASGGRAGGGPDAPGPAVPCTGETRRSWSSFFFFKGPGTPGILTLSPPPPSPA